MTLTDKDNYLSNSVTESDIPTATISHPPDTSATELLKSATPTTDGGHEIREMNPPPQAPAVKDSLQKWWYYAIFAASGFSALIYESLWTRYLKIFLGHAAYAQALVLAIFLLGLAGGSALVARFSTRLTRPLLAYVAVEAVLALAAIYFHHIYVATLDWALNFTLPATQTIEAATLLKWGLAAALIFPQALLLGATFPLLSAGMLRLWDKRPGEIIAMLYFTNFLGAAIGVLCNSFLLLPALGLPGAGAVGSMINFAIAALVWILILRYGEGKQPPPPAISYPYKLSRLEWILIVVAAVTGLSSFIYEIMWVRMISLLLGASTHSFEIVLGVFIAGLALGSLLVKQRIDKVAEPLVLLGSIQVVMGCLAMVSLLAYPFLFEQYIAQWSTEARDTTAYVKHLLFGAGLATALMLPVTICAGMTLPLITRLLMAQRGEASLGIVYAANTIGSIIGVFLAVHVLLTHVGVKNGILIGALADVLLGIGLFAYVGRRLFSFTATSFTTAVLAVTLLFGNIPLQYAAAGVFRHGQAIGENQKIVFYRDGKTASISVLERTNGLKSDKSIRTNGKIDAAIVYDNQSDNYSSDEMTMTMLGLLPLLARPDARTAANIGFGSGLTTRTLLQSSKLQRVDNIEIEPMVIAGAQQMGEKVAPVFSDPRNHFIIDDAKSAFIRTGGKYDIIVSGPSNPWISGVASLFTKEFYRRVRTSLAQDGVFVQWTPLYESSPQLVASIARALSEEFSDFRMYLSSSSDLVIITVADGQVPPLLSAIFADDNAREFFGYYGFHSAPDVEQLFVGDKKHMLPYYESFNTPANSDYFPYLEHHAPLSFFTKTHYIWPNVRSLPVPVMEMAGDWKMSPEAVAALPRSPLANEIASARKLFASLKEENGELIRLINAMQSLSCYSNRHDTTENEEENTVIKRSEHGSDNPESKVDLTLSSTNSEEEENNADMAANNNNGNNAGKYMLSVSSLITRLMPHISRENMLVVWELLEEEGCVAEQLADAGSIAGIYTQFWRALSLRDATTLADTTQELFSYSDFNTQSGQIVLLSAMAAQYQLGNYSRVLSLINQLPLVNPTIHHATRFIAAQAATKI